MPSIWVEINARLISERSDGYTPVYKRFDWPTVPRKGEMVLIDGFTKAMPVEGVAHIFSEGKIIICLEVSEKEFESAIDEDDKTWLNESEFAKHVSAVLDQQVEDAFHFSVRTLNCLKNENINTVRELLGVTERDLRCMPNFGPKSLKEIKEQVEKRGWTIGQFAQTKQNTAP